MTSQPERGAGDAAGADSPYDAIAELYDPWSAGVTEDIDFYVSQAVAATRFAAEPTVVELGVGTGRIALPIASRGIRVIGVDSSRGMLDVCRRAADERGLTHLVDLRVGDLRHPPVEERVPFVACPFRSLLHMRSDDDRLRALRAVNGLLTDGGRFVFDVFAPGADDIAETHGRWLEREPGIYERADWDENQRTLTLSVRGPESEASMTLAWLTPEEWRRLLEEAGFRVDACYGWFDSRPYAGGEDSVWVTSRLPG